MLKRLWKLFLILYVMIWSMIGLGAFAADDESIKYFVLITLVMGIPPLFYWIITGKDIFEDIV